MVSINKPKSITVVVLDRNTKKSKSITVYGTTMDDAFKLVQKAFKGKG